MIDESRSIPKDRSLLSTKYANRNTLRDTSPEKEVCLDKDNVPMYHLCDAIVIVPPRKNDKPLS